MSSIHLKEFVCLCERDTLRPCRNQRQMSAVRIQSNANFILKICFLSTALKSLKIKKKRSGMAHLITKNMESDRMCYAVHLIKVIFAQKLLGTSNFKLHPLLVGRRTLNHEFLWTENNWVDSGCHSSVVLSAPTIRQPRAQIPSTPSTLFSFFIVEIEIVIDIGMKWTKISENAAGASPYVLLINDWVERIHSLVTLTQINQVLINHSFFTFFLHCVANISQPTPI